MTSDRARGVQSARDACGDSNGVVEAEQAMQRHSRMSRNRAVYSHSFRVAMLTLLAPFVRADLDIDWERSWDHWPDLMRDEEGETSTSERFLDLIADSAGNSLVLTQWGYVRRGLPATPSRKGVHLSRWSVDGELEWWVEWEGLRSGVIAAAGESRVAIAGFVGVDVPEISVRVFSASDGELLWEAVVASPGVVRFVDGAAFDGAGSLVVAGSVVDPAIENDGNCVIYPEDFSCGAPCGARIEHPGCDVVLWKLDPQGQLAWRGLFDGGLGDRAHRVAIGPQDSVYLAGTSDFGNRNIDYFTAKFDANGNERWRAFLGGEEDAYDELRDLAVDSFTGDAWVTGCSWSNQTEFDYLTGRFDSATGSVLWSQRFDTFAHLGDFGVALTVDGLERSFVTGEVTLRDPIFSEGERFWAIGVSTTEPAPSRTRPTERRSGPSSSILRKKVSTTITAARISCTTSARSSSLQPRTETVEAGSPWATIRPRESESGSTTGPPLGTWDGRSRTTSSVPSRSAEREFSVSRRAKAPARRS